MQIKSNEEMFGLPIIKLREFFKRYMISDYCIENVMEFFDLERDKAEALIIKLEREGYVKKASKFRDEQFWENAIKGNALVMASAAKPIRRSTAERKINEFLERVKEVNRNDYYLFKVKKVVVFGSYLSDTEKLGDIDLAIEIVPKESDRKKFRELSIERSREAKLNGRRFNNIVEEVYWSQTEVLMYLKSRSRSISIHFIDEPIIKKSKHRVIFEAE